MMILTRWQPLAWISGFVAVASVAFAQPVQREPHIGYTYPAGARQGTTIQAVVGGQFLDDVSDVCVSGGGVQATVLKHTKPLTQRQANQLRDKVRMARERLREAKKKGPVPDEASALVAYARELGVSEEQLKALEEFQKNRSDPKRQPNPQIEEIVRIELKLGPEVQPGQHDLRLKTPSGLTNPVRFYVNSLTECRESDSVDRLDVTEIQEPLPVILNGQILPGDIDRFRFRAQRNQRLVASVSARRLIPYLADAVPGWFQATLTLFDSNGREVAYSDDHYFHPDPVLFCKIPADGFYVLEIHDAIFRGREDFIYRISLGEIPYVTSIFPLGVCSGDQAIAQVSGWNLPSRTVKLDALDRAPGVHRMTVRGRGGFSNDIPFAVDTLPECVEEEPNNGPLVAQRLSTPVIVNGRMDQAGDWDVFAFEGNAGDRVIAEVHARRLNSPLDSCVQITDTNGKQLVANDDHEDSGEGLTTHHADSYVCVSLPESGTYYLHLGDTQNKGGRDYGYRLRIGGLRPDFQLFIAPSTLNLRAGTTVPISVGALRRDEFSDDIALSLKDAPPGFALSGAWIPAHQDIVRLTLTIPPVPPDRPVSVRLEGHARVGGREITRPVVPSDDMTQAFIYHHFVPTRDLVVCVSESPPRGKRPGPPSGNRRGVGEVTSVRDEPVRLPAGGSARIQLPTTRWRALNQARLELDEAPEGISLRTVASAAGGMAILLSADASKVQPGLKGNLIIEAFARGTAPRPSGRPANRARRGSLGILPAIPFEIIDSHHPSP